MREQGDAVTVTRIGTQVVVRLCGAVGGAISERLDRAVDEVADLVLNRVVVDLDQVEALDERGVEFLEQLARRWPVRYLHTGAHLRGRLPRRQGVAS